MPYASAADLEDAFGEAEIAQFADPGKIDAALVRADGLIDGYLAGRYLTPLAAPIPPVIVAAAADLARYFLYDDAAPDRVRAAYEDVLAWLKDAAAVQAATGFAPRFGLKEAAAGGVVLPLPAVGGEGLVGAPVGAAEPRVFTRATTHGF